MTMTFGRPTEAARVCSAEHSRWRSWRGTRDDKRVKDETKPCLLIFIARNVCVYTCCVHSRRITAWTVFNVRKLLKYNISIFCEKWRSKMRLRISGNWCEYAELSYGAVLHQRPSGQVLGRGLVLVCVLCPWFRAGREPWRRWVG